MRKFTDERYRLETRLRELGDERFGPERWGSPA